MPPFFMQGCVSSLDEVNKVNKVNIAIEREPSSISSSGLSFFVKYGKKGLFSG